MPKKPISARIEIMENTLRERLLTEIIRIDARCEQLSKYLEEYQWELDYENALITNVKLKQLNMVSQNLKDIL
tara:strand:- start:69 stop:287 length:219 start_codon:yes stop_codon:yes gene_type:complete